MKSVGEIEGFSPNHLPSKYYQTRLPMLIKEAILDFQTGAAGR